MQYILLYQVSIIFLNFFFFINSYIFNIFGYATVCCLLIFNNHEIVSLKTIIIIILYCIDLCVINENLKFKSKLVTVKHACFFHLNYFLCTFRVVSHILWILYAILPRPKNIISSLVFDTFTRFTSLSYARFEIFFDFFWPFMIHVLLH